MGKLDQRVAIITGGGTGIGRNIALEFAKEGAKVVIGSRNMANLEKVVEEIKALGGHSLAIATDVSVAEQVRSMVKQTVDKFGRIDILVNNAGILHSATLLEMTEQDWDDVLDINLKGVFLCTQAVARYMMEQRYGKIINISSNSGRGGGLDDCANYCVSKAGVIQLTKSSAFELGPYGINVNAIAPGIIQTSIYKVGRTPEQIKEFEEETIRATVLGKLGVPEDIARLALFLASEDSSFISGQTIPVDGGRTDRM
ncbi:MAG: 3-oxoacyl-ACP reductase FabG [Dehalococcoidia bacterium]|nr:3-oxoacyl-ACP reductase FabG [Dehalococcoidia bacterium]